MNPASLADEAVCVFLFYRDRFRQVPRLVYVFPFAYGYMIRQ